MENYPFKHFKHFVVLSLSPQLFKLRIVLMTVALLDMLCAAFSFLTLGTVAVKTSNYWGLMDLGERLVREHNDMRHCGCECCDTPGTPRLTQKEIEKKLDEMRDRGAPIEEVTAWLKSKGIEVDVIPLSVGQQTKDDEEETFH